MKTHAIVAFVAILLFNFSSVFGQITLEKLYAPVTGDEITSGEFGEEILIKLDGYSYKDYNVFMDSTEKFLWMYRGGICWKNSQFDIVRLYGEKVKYKQYNKLKGGDMNIEKVHITDRNDIYFTGLSGKKMCSISGAYLGDPYADNYMRSPNVKVTKTQITDGVVAGSGQLVKTDNLIVKIKKDDKGKYWLSIQKRVVFECASGDCANGDGKMLAPNLKYQGSFKDGKPNGNGVLVYYKPLLKDNSVCVKYEGEFKDGQVTGNGKLSLHVSDYTSYPIYTGTVLNGIPNGNGSFKMPSYNRKVSIAFTKAWTENYKKFFKGINPNITDIVLEEFTGNFVNGYPEGKGDFKVSCNVLGNKTEFAGNVTFAGGEIQKPYSLTALTESGYKNYETLGKSFSGKAKFTLKDGKVAAPITIATSNGEVSIHDFEVKEVDGKPKVIIKKLEGYIDYDFYVKAEIGSDGIPIGEYGYVKDKKAYFASNYQEKASCKGGVEQESGFTYEGDVYCENFMIYATGQGKKTFESGTVHEGQFKNSVMISGKQNYSTGNKYIGEFDSNGKFSGKGSYIWKDGDKYEGEFKDGKFHGQGTYTGVNGNKYVGQWAYDKKHGKGKYTWKNGDYYDGNWTDGKKSGEGYAKWRGEDYSYEGPTYNGRNKGKGTYRYKNGDVYTGEVDGTPNGQGTMKYANGTTKTGRFVNGVYSPYGPCTCEFDSYDDTDTKEWYNGTLTINGGAKKTFKLVWSESESENRVVEYFHFTANGRNYYYKWISVDVSDPGGLGLIPNTEGAVRRNYKGDNTKIGKTTDEGYMMKLILREIFKENCSSVIHDY